MKKKRMMKKKKNTTVEDFSKPTCNAGKKVSSPYSKVSFDKSCKKHKVIRKERNKEIKHKRQSASLNFYKYDSLTKFEEKS